ncbi:ATP-binding protein [Nocardia terpenica]|nr:tetratricopeptide repeat protein [Nocardia terpenica]NQE92138.1 XRE family transcriptional regulator [Nocardia terpenica]
MDGSRNTTPEGAGEGFGAALRKLRMERGISAAHLARQLNYSKGHLNNVEKGVKRPSPEFIRACDDALDAHGALLALMPQPRPPRAHPPVRPAQLPPGPTHFVGRDRQLALLEDLRADGEGPLVVVVNGRPGVGKTTLALSWTRRIRDDYPDGVLVADLRGYSPSQPPAEPAEVLEEFLRALGVSPDRVPSTVSGRSALYRSLLDGHRTVVVLDNAVSSAQVRPLLPGATGAVAIVTSRDRLSSLAIHDGAYLVDLDVFTEREAIELLCTVVGPDRVRAHPDAAADVVRRCANLPLAVRVAAERIAARPALTLTDLAADLADESSRLAALAVDDEAPVHAVFSWSYRGLSPAVARMFRTLALHAGPGIGLGAAAALADVSVAEARNSLGRLVIGHLVDEVRHERFRFHDLVRLYAREQVDLDPPAETSAAVHRELVWYLRTVHAASLILGPSNQYFPGEIPTTGPPPPALTSYEDAVGWFELELTNIVAATRQAYELGWYELAWQIPHALFEFLHLQQPWSIWENIYRIGLAAAEKAHSRSAEAWMRHGLGLVNLGLRRFPESFTLICEALEIRRADGDIDNQAWGMWALGALHMETDRIPAAFDGFDEALRLFGQANDDYGQAATLNTIAHLHHRLGDSDKALPLCSEALAIYRASGNRHGEGDALHQLGEVHAALGQLDDALRCLEEALKVRRTTGDSKGEADTLVALAEISHRSGSHGTAREYLEQAVDLFAERGDPRSPRVDRLLDEIPRRPPPEEGDTSGTTARQGR